MRGIRGAIVIFGLLAAAACAGPRLEKALDPESREFLSRVRYIISREERATFLRIPAGEQGAFIEDFWKARDPNPETEINEFKETYFRRMEEADHLFRGGTTPGRLQDRGRIYILLGPPDNRESYPRGTSFYGYPVEIWHYGFTPIVFRDPRWTNDFRVDPMSAEYIVEIGRAQQQPRRVPQDEAARQGLDFGLDILRAREGAVRVILKIPYAAIWMRAEDGRMETVFELDLELRDLSDREVLTFRETYPISLTDEEFARRKNEIWTIEIPVSAEPGEYLLTLALKNATGGDEARKTAKVTLE
ncbi:MAG: GWxTD domain-containing protein [Acidobacteriota bacterium]|nr:GWxTD domain-containing protein [Acidobacteriota bacterium]